MFQKPYDFFHNDVCFCSEFDVDKQVVSLLLIVPARENNSLITSYI